MQRSPGVTAFEIAIIVLLPIILLVLLAVYGAVLDIRDNVHYIMERTSRNHGMLTRMSVSWKRRMDSTLSVSPDIWNYDDPDGYWISSTKEKR